MTLSICSICQDEEDLIGWYLNCCKYTFDVLGEKFRGVILVDGGSKDGTVDIINSYKDKLPLTLIEHPFDTFGQQKNRALDIATGDYVFGPDTDMTWTTNFPELFKNGKYNKSLMWDFKMLFTVRDRNHFFRNWNRGVNMRLWKGRRKFTTNFHEKLEGQTQGLPVCPEVVIFENSMRASDQACRNRGIRYQKFIEGMSKEGKGPGHPDRYISAKYSLESEIGELPKSLQNLILENT